KPASTTGTQEYLLYEMVENTRVNTDLTIDISSAHEQWQTDETVIVDVRDRDAFDEMHLHGSLNIPLDELPEYIFHLPEDKDTPILTLCQRGEISLMAVLFLTSLGYRNVRSVNGGTIAWRELGYPVE
ncbi:hypothetical protein MNBD_ACTINO01-1931, partial [hydrothermal vent metagenome]